MGLCDHILYSCPSVVGLVPLIITENLPLSREAGLSFLQMQVYYPPPSKIEAGFLLRQVFTSAADAPHVHVVPADLYV